MSHQVPASHRRDDEITRRPRVPNWLKVFYATLLFIVVLTVISLTLHGRC
jgi:hypothetical protein